MPKGEKLGKYRSMRDFGDTPEPSGPDPEDVNAAGRFVIQEHHARRLHWDFRLERDGVLVSWAVPKGLPPEPKVNHLAVHTEDHPLDYFDFEGEIPRGNYGAGKVIRWDAGTYECEKWEEAKVVVVLHGERVQGRYALFRTRGEDWMVHRMDPPQDPTREPMPESVTPMEPIAGELPTGDGWAYEILWTGLRTIAFVEGGRARLATGSGDDVSDRFPELRPLGPAVGSRELVLDGELVVLDGAGRPDAERLARRLEAASDAAARRGQRDHPAIYVIFDVLYDGGHTTTALPYRERRRRLEELGLAGPAWQVPAAHEGDGPALAEAARGNGLPGLVAKQLDSGYEFGQSSAWVRVAVSG